jgi:integral membrane sensor domain MASE1
MLTNLSEKINHIIGILFILMIFALAYGYLKPHRLHKRRMVSTMLLKVSYLLYLLILLIVIYLAVLVKGGLQEVFYELEFFVFLFVLFVPTMGIFARRLERFSRKREGYNYFFTGVNVVSIIALLVMYFY